MKNNELDNDLRVDNFEFLEEFYQHTSNIDLASTLICKGYVIEELAIISDTETIFTFMNDDETKKVVHEFWANNITIKPIEFANARRNLESRILDMK